MACNDNTSSGCDGCVIQLGSECVFYNSTTLDCISVETGTSLEDILKNINSVVCELSPSGQLISVVESGDSNLDVTSSVAGNTTTYTITMSASFLAQITTINANISSIVAQLADLPITISTDTPADIQITHPSANLWKVNYIGSSGGDVGGVIYSNPTQLTIANQNSASYVRRKYFSFDYTTDYGTPHTGDIIKIKSTFQVPCWYVLGANGGRAKLGIGDDVTGVTNQAEFNYVESAQSEKTFTLLAEAEIHVVNLSNVANNALITGRLYHLDSGTESDYDYPGGNFYSPTYTLVSHALSYYVQLDWTTLTISTYTSGNYNPLALVAKNDLLTVELIKKI